MKDEEKVVTVENTGDKGNPNHVPAGDPQGKGGQFTSAEGTGGGGNAPKVSDSDEMGPIVLEEAPKDAAFGSKLSQFIAMKKEKLNQEARDFIGSVSGSVPEEQKQSYSELTRDEKIGLLSKSPVGYDTKKLKFATDEQINALLMSEAVTNRRVQLEQNLLLLEKQKNDINDGIKNELSQNNIDGISGVWAYSTKYPADWKELKDSGSIDKKRDYYQSVLNNPDAGIGQKGAAMQYLKKLDEFEVAGQEYEKLKSEIELSHIDELEQIEAKTNELKDEISKYNSDSPIIQAAKEYQNKFTDINSVYSKARKNNATWITEKWIKEHPEYNELNVISASVKYFGPKFEKMWSNMTYEEKNQLVDYTGGGYSKYNKPLRGIKHGGWESWDFASNVKTLTNAIDKCVWDEDIWVQRGISDSKIFQLPGSNQLKSLSQMTDSELYSLVGTSFKDNGFYSAGAAKGTGFTGNTITFNTYCPKGTKMAYMNTKGHYSYSGENEMILQRGYSYRITKIEKKGSDYYIDCEVILGSDDNKITDQEALKALGKKYLG